MPSKILDWTGRPATFFAGASYTSPSYSKPKARHGRMDTDAWHNYSQSSHRDMLSDARWIASFPLVSGMLSQKADYVSAAGWLPHYIGSEDAWGKDAENKVHEALKLFDYRGIPFEILMAIGCETLDVDGDYFVLLTETATGFPKGQMIEAHRVGSRGGNIIKGGPYDGALCVNGIIYDTTGEELAYNVLGPKEADDVQISASDMFRVRRQRRFTEGRPVSPVAIGVPDWVDIKATREAEKVAQRANAAITLVESNDTGSDDPAIALSGDTPKTPGGLQIEDLEDGTYKYVKNGGSLQAHSSNRPSQGSRQFEQDVAGWAAFGMQWRLEMMDLSKLGGAGVRGFQDNINTVILSRFNVLKQQCALRIVRYVVAKLIKRGDLEPSADWWKWDFCQPPEFTVDANRAVSSDIDAIRAGLDFEENVVRSRLGMTYEAFLRARARAAKLRAQIAKDEGVPEWQLGYVTRPGDVPTQGTAPAQQPIAA